MENMKNGNYSDTDQVMKVWRRNGLKPGTRALYADWVRRYESYCQLNDLDLPAALTRTQVREFANHYALKRGINGRTAMLGACRAVRSWAIALRILGCAVPLWQVPSAVASPLSALLEEYAQYLRYQRGSPASTICSKLYHISKLIEFTGLEGMRIVCVDLQAIDAFVISCSSKFARRTTASICSSIRGFLRFLHATGRVSSDLSASVAAPVVRREERPLRALPWVDVKRILRAVDRKTFGGKRDYAMLLLMSAYGLGAGETIRLTLDDIDWRAQTLRVSRPKTGVVNVLPLLPSVAQALASYLRRGRAPDAETRHLFVSRHAPYRPLSASGAVRHMLIKYARLAGVSAPYLGSHVLRHSHAMRHMEQGTRTKVIADILGHRRADATSAYVRTATECLRELALPVPR